MNSNLTSRLLDLAVAFFATDMNSESLDSLTKSYIGYYSSMNKEEVKLSHNEAFIKGPVMMEKFFLNAIVDDAPGKNSIIHVDAKINLKKDFILDIISIFETENEFLKGLSNFDKRSIIVTLIGIDHLFLTALFEYGPKALPTILDGKLANTGQWWAFMEMNDFSDSAFTHADRLLKVTKKSKISHQLNGASALFPSNMTYARFVDIVKGKAEHLVILHKYLLHATSPQLKQKIDVNENAHKLFDLIVNTYMFHIIALVDLETYRFSNFYLGYYNMWRYNNRTLHKNLSRLIDGI